MHNPKLPNVNHRYNLEWYHQRFKDAQPGQLKGEISPTYLWSQTAPQEIFEYNPNIKLLAILRNPVDKAFSLYLFYRQIGVLRDISLREALEERPDLLSRGLYYQQLSRYFGLFPLRNVKVVLFDDMVTDKVSLLYEIEKFLGVEKFIPVNVDEKINPTKATRFSRVTYGIEKARQFLRQRQVFWLLELMRKTNVAKLGQLIVQKNTFVPANKLSLNPVDRDWLINYYRMDIEKLGGLIDRDLQFWTTSA